MQRTKRIDWDSKGPSHVLIDGSIEIGMWLEEEWTSTSHRCMASRPTHNGRKKGIWSVSCCWKNAGGGHLQQSLQCPADLDL